MSYLALARKWRPRSFKEVVGQAHVVKALSNALDNDRVHHAYLFTGTRGVGKTTLARIFAKSLNCEQGAGSEPCQQCNTCLAVDEGRFVDLIEVDAASRTKVDDTRELLENVQYAPTAGKYKVYLIDEVHMLSGHSFNALLKTLEEPPQHVKFLFATTDPQKMPVTVLSRCLQFNLRAMRPEQVENQLAKILDAEAIEYETAALRALAKAADGSMRDGLSLLDQAIAQSSGGISLAEVGGMLGTLKKEHSDALIAALAAGDAAEVMRVVHEMANYAVDFATALDDVLVYLYNISLAQVAPSALVEGDADYAHFATQFSAEDIQLYYQIGLKGKQDLPLAPSQRVGFEMTLLRMLVFEPYAGAAPATAPSSSAKPNSSAAASQRSDVREAPTGALRNAVQDQTLPPSEPGEPISNHPAHDQDTADQVSAEPSAGPSPEPASRPESASKSDSALEPQRMTEPQVGKSPEIAANETVSRDPNSPGNRTSNPTDTRSVDAPRDRSGGGDKPHSASALALAGQNEWGEIVEQTNLSGMPRQLAMNCACEKLDEEKITLSLAPSLKHLLNPDRLAEVQAAVQQLSGQALQLTIEIEESDKETPAECLQRLGFEQKSQIKAEIESDPGVKALMSEFGASIVEQSIKPSN